MKLNYCTYSNSNWAEFQQKFYRNSTEILQKFVNFYMPEKIHCVTERLNIQDNA